VVLLLLAVVCLAGDEGVRLLHVGRREPDHGVDDPDVGGHAHPPILACDTANVRAFVCAGAGFLLAVVWFDLMFDVQVLRLAKGDAPDAAVTSIARYYRRVTSDARPMNRLVALVMVAVIAGIVVELVRDSVPAWVG